MNTSFYGTDLFPFCLTISNDTENGCVQIQPQKHLIAQEGQICRSYTLVTIPGIKGN